MSKSTIIILIFCFLSKLIPLADMKDRDQCTTKMYNVFQADLKLSKRVGNKKLHVPRKSFGF